MKTFVPETGLYITSNTTSNFIATSQFLGVTESYWNVILCYAKSIKVNYEQFMETKFYRTGAYHVTQPTASKHLIALIPYLEEY